MSTENPNTELDADSVARWVAKGRARSAPLLDALSTTLAAPAEVVGCQVASTADAPFGGFMVCWPDEGTTPRTIWHLPDAGFFLDNLRDCYAPVFDKRPSLERLLDGRSRLEMAMTNDVLQVQLHGTWQAYSMIRHHALMLLFALVWLEEPDRSGWGDLYEAILLDQRHQQGGLPPAEMLSDVEAKAFDEYSTQPTAGPAGARYQLLAAAAVGLLWREYSHEPPDHRQMWLHHQLQHYGDEDYLIDRWESLRLTGA